MMPEDQNPDADDVVGELGLGRYRKTITAVVGGAVIITTAWLGSEVGATVAAVATALGVYAIPNKA